jgi:rhodanese-related sulfurtransferase
MTVTTMTSREVQEALAGGKVLLIDVREPWEFERAKILGSQLMPLGSIPAQLSSLPRDRPIVFVCHHGMRSMRACQLAQAQGLSAINLTGGIAAWSAEVDPSVPQY